MAPSQQRRKLGRRALPFCDPSRPYREWPFSQLLEECKRRRVPVIRKGPHNNASKNGLARALQQNDAEAAASGEFPIGEDHAAAAQIAMENTGARTRGAIVDGVVVHAGPETLDDDDDDESVDFAGENRMSEPDEPPADKQREANIKYDATFRLVNVLFSTYAARFSELMRSGGSEEDLDSLANEPVWGDVEESFGSSTPAFSKLINDHEMFAGINPSLNHDQQLQRAHHSRRSLASVWRRLCTTYSLALQHARQIDADNAQFYHVCCGRLDVLYLHLWVLLKPQLATHFTPVTSDHVSVGSAEPGDAATPSNKAAIQPIADTEQGPGSSPVKRTRKRKCVQNKTSSLNVQSAPTTQPDSTPSLHAEYLTLKLQVLREKQTMLAAGAAREQMRFLEERRRGLLRDVRDLSTTIAELQQRLLQASRADSNRSRSPATDRELEQDVAFFQRQKQQRMADVTQCGQQIQQQLATSSDVS